jgi:hypothetical protein
LIVLAVGLAVLSPLRHGRGDQAPGASPQGFADLELRKEAKYREIRDAEGDFQAGKLSEEDYRELDGVLRQEAIEILAEIDRAGSGAHHDG